MIPKEFHERESRGMQLVLAVRAPAAVAKPEHDFDQVVRDHKNRIFNYVCRLTHDSPDAEDITQEVFIRAYQSLHAFRRDAALDTWLYRIATNLVIDRARKERRGYRTVSVDESEEGDEPRDLPSTDRGGDPAASSELGELKKQVRRAIQSLPLKLRAVVILHDLEGLPYEEVAQTVGCPVGTVKSRLFNGRALLRRKLSYFLE